jgi:fatty acid desaturase
VDDSEERRKAAVTQLKAKKDFKRSAFAYVIVNSFLVAIWVLGDGGSFWPIWPILGWGIALAFQAWNAYFRKPITEDDIRREMGGGS